MEELYVLRRRMAGIIEQRNAFLDQLAISQTQIQEFNEELLKLRKVVDLTKTE